MNLPPMQKFKRLDVRPMLARGEEPLPVIRAGVGALQADEGLVVLAPFLPSPLIERLNSDGYRFKVERGDGGAWMVYFWHEAD